MESRSLDKWVLVTGANDGGRGEAIVAAFLARGFNVIAASIEQAKLAFTKPAPESNDGFLVRLGLDGTSSKSIESAVQNVDQLTDGKLDLLINIAGCGYYMPLMDVRIKDARHQFDVNVWGALAVVQAFFPMLREAKGSVVNHITSAGLGGVNDPYMGVYASSQAAIRSMSDIMRLELAPFGVKVITFVSGPAYSQPARPTTEDMRFGLPEDSPYRLIEDDAVESMLGLISRESGHNWYQVAEHMVTDLQKVPAPTFILDGIFTVFLWWIGWMIPAWLTDWMALQRGGLSRMAGPPQDKIPSEKSL